MRGLCLYGEHEPPEPRHREYDAWHRLPFELRAPRVARAVGISFRGDDDMTVDGACGNDTVCEHGCFVRWSEHDDLSRPHVVHGLVAGQQCPAGAVCRSHARRQHGTQRDVQPEHAHRAGDHDRTGEQQHCRAHQSTSSCHATPRIESCRRLCSLAVPRNTQCRRN